MTIERAVFNYWVATCQHHDREEAQKALDYIRPYTQRILQNAGVAWGDDQERFLKSAALNYTVYCGMTFLDYFVVAYRRTFCWLSETRACALSEYSETGLSKFKEYEASNPERCALERMN